MTAMSVARIVLLSFLGFDTVHAQQASRSALAYRHFSKSGTESPVVQRVDSAQVKSHKTRNVLVGIAVGAVIGGSTAYVLAKQSCGQGPYTCDDPGPVIVPTVLFTILGGIGGGTVVRLSGRSRDDHNAKGMNLPPVPSRSVR